MRTYSFYTYSKIHGEDIILTIEALDEDSAWELFESKYPGYYVDMVVDSPPKQCYNTHIDS
jgi:hypothetical protein